MGITHGSVNFLFLNFKRVKEKKKRIQRVDLRAEEWLLLDSAVTPEGLSPGAPRVSLLQNIPAAQHWTRYVRMATVKVTASLCLWYTPADFLFPVLVYTDTQCAQFLKLSFSKGNANINFVEAHPPHTLVQDFSDNLLKLPSGKHTPSDESQTGTGLYVSSCKWIYTMWFQQSQGIHQCFDHLHHRSVKAIGKMLMVVFSHLAKLFRFQKLLSLALKEP